MPAQKWSAAQQSEALALAAERGPVEAARQLGIPDGTVRWWMHQQTERAGKALATVGATMPAEVDERDAQGRRSLSWHERQRPLVHALGVAASAAVEACQQAISEGRARDAKDLSICAGVLVDKAQLLSGFATSRTEGAHFHAGVDDAEQARRIADLERRLGLRDD